MTLICGDIVELKLPLVEGKIGLKGIVYDHLDEWGLHIIFENGYFDRFSKIEEKNFLRKTGRIRNYNYKFTSVNQLKEDYNKGFFCQKFTELKIQEEEKFPEELEDLLNKLGISRAKIEKSC